MNNASEYPPQLLEASVAATAQPATPSPSHLTSGELIELAAIDRDFFVKTFFPKTARQTIPEFHHRIWDLLESSSRLVNIQVFRDGAKTSLLRMYTAKRIAYGLARTILYIGKSEGHAIRSVRWIRRQIETNRLFAQTFCLTPGKKWQDIECEISHGLENHTVTILALGITGSVRGVNIDDYRPDLIVLDDVVDEENAATPEQRKKINDLIYGALKQSLAPATESPDAKMVGLQTPLNREDYSVLALNDPEWRSARFGVWTPETEDKPIQYQESSWPARYPSETLRKEKEAYTSRNQLSIWMREKECKVVSPETSTFIPTWLKFYDILPEGLTVYSGIDPVPPPSDKQIQQGMQNKDFEAVASIGKKGANYYLLDYSLNRGHEPSWTIQQFFRHSLAYHPRQWVVESTAYQRTLAWILRQAMAHQRKYYVINEFTDQRRKFDLIVDAISGLASNGHLYVKREHVDFITQFSDYPNVRHDDLINVVAMIITVMEGGVISDDDFAHIDEEEKHIPPLEYNRSLMAP